MDQIFVNLCENGEEKYFILIYNFVKRNNIIRTRFYIFTVSHDTVILFHDNESSNWRFKSIN